MTVGSSKQISGVISSGCLYNALYSLTLKQLQMFPSSCSVEFTPAPRRRSGGASQSFDILIKVIEKIIWSVSSQIRRKKCKYLSNSCTSRVKHEVSVCSDHVPLHLSVCVEVWDAGTPDAILLPLPGWWRWTDDEAPRWATSVTQ